MRRAELLSRFVAELAHHGLTDAVVCPGSRNTPLVLAFARHGRIPLHVALDERSAAFFALGIGKGGGLAAVVATSGTAAANFLPAVVEARLAHVPLLVLTADRPRELRDTGALQTIDQVRLYGSHAKWFLDLPDLEAEDRGKEAYVLRAAARAVTEARAQPAGPVHLNFPLAEPLVDEEIPAPSVPPYLDPSPLLAPARAEPPELPAYDLRRALVVAAEGAPPAAHALAEHLEAPLLADPLSGLRGGDAIGAYDLIVRAEEAVSRLCPSVVFRFGTTPVSKALQEAMGTWARQGTAFVHVVPHEPFWDALRLPGLVLSEAAARELPRCLPKGPAKAYRDLWRHLARALTTLLAELLAESTEFEGRALSALAAARGDAPLFLGNSLPVRAADTFVVDRLPAPVFANRGASGIDGVVSTALGVAAALRRPSVLVLGDISFYHDQNGLLLAAREGIPLTTVVLHNDGGGIFSLLPQAELPEFEAFFGTPHGLDFRHTASLFQLPYEEVGRSEELARLVAQNLEAGRPGILVLRFSRAQSAERHRAVVQAAVQVVSARLRAGT